ncbi:MAG: Na/Pi cotransporter family protein [Anaerovoracaceae bacterium]
MENNLTFFDVLNLIGGLALFLFGMNTLSDGLTKVSGSRLERLLERLTVNKFTSILLGAGVTAVIQSSSATTVMVVGFVNSGIMKLSQAVGIIMGANIGTTITSWILSLTGIQSESFAMQLLKPTSFSPVLAIIGVMMIFMSKRENRRDIGMILVGFAVLMFGMEMMSSSVKPLADVPAFTNMLITFSNPLLGMLLGMLVTAAIQSSSASIGILQALCLTGSVTYSTAIPIIMGQNIGTCITAILSAIGANKNAKRAACIHLYFNLIGTLVFMAMFYFVNAFADFAFMDKAAGPAGIAIVHSLFNISATLLLFPFSNLLVKFATVTIRETTDEEKKVSMYAEDSFLDDRFLDRPGFALQLSRSEAEAMATLSRDSMYMALKLLKGYNKEKAEAVIKMEQRVDKYEDDLGTFLLKLSGKQLSQADSRILSIIMHGMGDFERISDHAINIVDACEEMHKKGLKFSQEAQDELEVMTDAVYRILRRATRCFIGQSIERSRKVEPLEQVIDALSVEIRQRHIRRLRAGKCTIELGFILSDIVTVLERVADHCSNIAVCIIEVNKDGFDTHEYLDIIKRGDNQEFQEKFKKYQEDYQLPYVDYDEPEETTEEVTH